MALELTKIGKHKLYLGDYTTSNEMDRYDAVVTDPPYSRPTMVAQSRSVIERQKKKLKLTTVGDLSVMETAYRTIFEKLDKRLADDGRMFVFCDSHFYPTLYRLIYGDFNTALLVWDKGKIGLGREFRHQFELILHCWQVNTPIMKTDRIVSDILRVKPVSIKNRAHLAEKPVALLRQLLHFCGNHVIDPFMGSGSTGVACIQTGRTFIGYEIDKGHYEHACKRLEMAYKNYGDRKKPLSNTKQADVKRPMF